MNNTITDSRTLAVHTLYNSLLTLSALGVHKEQLELLTKYHKLLLEDHPDASDKKMAEILEKVMEM